MKTKNSITISIAIGALCVPIFYSVYGIVANFDIEHRFLRWINIVPEEYRLSAGLFHSFIIEMIAAIPIIAIAGIALGYLVKKNALLFGCIAVAAYFACGTIYSSILFERFVFSHYAPSVWYTISSIVAWILLFITMTRIGILMIEKRS
ncbi:MAG: hypothetical protein SV775_15550 [Thermodesulfobacteriota bacterium]|nr:hypothetical protein [Thermodesulfobacteriota bacterium]